MNRFTLAAAGALALAALLQEAEPPATVRPTKAEVELYSAVRESAGETSDVQRIVREFRAALVSTKPARPLLAYSPGDGSPRIIGSDVRPEEVVALIQALPASPVELRLAVARLYGANERLRLEVREMRELLDRENDWPPPEDRGDDDPPPPDDGGGEDDPPAPAAVYRIDCGGAGGDGWEADRLFVGGGTYQVQAGSGVYRSERFGSPVAYRLPVPAGRYTVRLHVRELFWTSPGSRVFDVAIEGGVVLEAFSPPSTATVREFVVDVTDGALDIVATPSRDNASLCGIEVVR